MDGSTRARAVASHRAVTAPSSSGRRADLRSAAPPTPHRAQEVASFTEHAPPLDGIAYHLPDAADDVRRAEVVAAVEALDGREDLVTGEVRIADRALLISAR